MHVHIITKQKV